MRRISSDELGARSGCARRSLMGHAMSNWTQPICEDCWARYGYGDQKGGSLVRFISVEPERCAWCGCACVSGIYVRADPASVAYPAADDERRS